MSDDLRGFAAREAVMGGKVLRRRIVRIARAALPEIFDLKDALVRACLDGEISEEERAELRSRLQAVAVALGQAALEEVDR